ncbi:Uncharacterised protein [Comamonas testosteroni]|uniref:Uncharacterized protein n=1 Tax=Comamonas testosteroni TaxID=285 RepID=A0A8B4S0K8_COMTE|nr:hypothetical protein DFO48_10617 [Comamonas sp. AG1104]SUY76313.1 Uncharacterised protein [Comamonas testosteroni]
MKGVASDMPSVFMSQSQAAMDLAVLAGNRKEPA